MAAGAESRSKSNRTRVIATTILMGRKAVPREEVWTILMRMQIKTDPQIAGYEPRIRQIESTLKNALGHLANVAPAQKSASTMRPASGS